PAAGQGPAEGRPAAGARLVRDRPAVLGDDAVADREAEPAATRLGREERREELGLVLLGDARPGVLDQHGERPLASRTAPDVEAAVETRGQRDLARPAAGFDGVLHEVQEHLRQLRPVAAYGGQARIERGTQHEPAPRRRLALEA